MIIEVPDDDVPAIGWALTAAKFTAHLLANGPYSTTADHELREGRIAAINGLLVQVDPDRRLDSTPTDPAH